MVIQNVPHTRPLLRSNFEDNVFQFQVDQEAIFTCIFPCILHVQHASPRQFLCEQMTRQHPRSRHWHVLCNKMKYMSMGVRQSLPSPSSPPQSKSCRCGQQNKQCLCWLSWFYKQGFVVQLHWLRTLGIGAKQLCTYMLCCLCWAVWLPQTLLLQSFSLWADRGLVTSKMSVHLYFVSLNNQEKQNILINLFIFKLLVERSF